MPRSLEGVFEAPETQPADQEQKTEAQIAFEEQLQQEHSLDLGTEKLDYAVVGPIENIEKGTSIVFIGGFATTREQYRREIINLAKLGKTIIFVNPDQGVEPDKQDKEYYSDMRNALPSSIVRKAAAVFKLIQHLGIQKADIVGNSQGAAVATGLVGAHPDIARRLVLDCPAGITGKEPVTSLLSRVAKDALIQKGERTIHQHRVHPELRAYDADVWQKYYAKVKKDLLWRITKETPDVARTDIRPALLGIKAISQDSNMRPRIILINASSDVIFGEKRVAAALGEDPLEYVDSWAMYANKDKKHSKYDQPQPDITPDEYFAPGRDSVLYQTFSTDPDVKRES